MCEHQGLVGCTRLKTYDQQWRVQCIVSQLRNTHNTHVQIMKLRTLQGQNNGSLANIFTEFTVLFWILQNIALINHPLLGMR
jgi:hypothetical protein